MIKLPSGKRIYTAHELASTSKQIKKPERFRTPEQQIALNIGTKLIDSIDDADQFCHISQDWANVSRALRETLRETLHCMQENDRSDLGGAA